MGRRLNPRNDFIFQRIFGDRKNKSILLSLLNAILGPHTERLYDIEVLDDTRLRKDRIEDRLAILDVRARTMAGVQIDIEVQLINEYNMDKRTLFYWSRMFTEQLSPGRSFSELKKTITINILDFTFLPLERYHSEGGA